MFEYKTSDWPKLLSAKDWRFIEQFRWMTDLMYQVSWYFWGNLSVSVSWYIVQVSHLTLAVSDLTVDLLCVVAPGGTQTPALVSTQLCLVLPPPSSSSRTCILLSTFLSPDLFSKYSLVALFLCGLVVSTVAPVWWCCHHFFLMCVQGKCLQYTLFSIFRFNRSTVMKF